MYYFDHHGSSSTNRGAGHGVEVAYVFGNFRSSNGPAAASAPFGRNNRFPGRGGFGGMSNRGNTLSAADKALSGLMSTYWINFARSGDPNGDGLPKWPAFSEKEQNVMYFGDTSVGVRPVPNLEQLKVFDLYFARRRMEAGAGMGRSN